jgi:hypothetical protein
MSATTSTKKPWAVFTIVRDESFYLPKWYAYYSQFLADVDIHIIHHVPKEKATTAAAAAKRDTCCDFLVGKECQIYVEDHEFFSSGWIRDIVKQYQARLLKQYEAVIFTDVDEIISIHPDSGFVGLGEFMTHFVQDKKHTNWRVNAYSLIHLPDLGEPSIDLARPILAQRMYWFRDDYFDKPLISKIPLNYVLGHHTATNMAKERNPHIYMIHLHQFDFDWYVRRHQRWAKDYKVSEEDKQATFNSHYRQKDFDKLVFQYYHYIFTQTRIVPTLVERWVRDRLQGI